MVALLGASGSGKTTLLNLISGIDTPDAGSVCIDSIDVHAVSEPGRTLLRRRDIGFVFQFSIDPTLTVGEHQAADGLLDTDARQARQRVQQLLGRSVCRRGGSLPGDALRRRAAAHRRRQGARHRPKILLLADRPTGNLDEDTGRQEFSLLSDMARHHDTTLLVVAARRWRQRLTACCTCGRGGIHAA